MTVENNRRYIRRFNNPGARPSNERTDPLLEHVRWQVAQLGRWMDEVDAEHGGPVSAAAEQILRNHDPRPRRSDPGE